MKKELMKLNRCIYVTLLCIGCANPTSDKKNINQMEDKTKSCKKYFEYYQKYKEDNDAVRESEGLNENVTLLPVSISYLQEDSILQVLAKDTTVCDKEKIMRYSLIFEDKNGEVKRSIIEITNTYQYEAIFFGGRENMGKKVIPPQIK